MKMVIIDGQGGRIGSLLAARIHREQIPNAKIYAIGTNSAETAAMMKGGADFGATGENPVLVACRDTDFIIGPLGILSADSLGRGYSRHGCRRGAEPRPEAFIAGKPLQ